jgi:hypothetical protein
LTASTGTGIPTVANRPSAGSLTTTGATLSWTAVTSPNYNSPVTYNVNVYLSGSTTVLQNFTGLTATRQAVANLTSRTAYEFDVTAVSNGQIGATSTKTRFTTR